MAVGGKVFMRDRYLFSLGALAGILGLASLAAVSLTGQTPAPAAKSAAAKSAAPAKPGGPPRTPWGDPDLQGTWFVLYDEPLERSAANAGKEFFTDAEVEALDAQKGLNPGRNARSADQSQDVSGAYNAVFNSVLKTGKRTSMIVDPPDGKIPPLVSGAQGPGSPGNAEGFQARASDGSANPAPADNPETAGQIPGGSPMVRCLGVTMPFLPLNTLFAQGTVMQVVQSPKSLGIYMEDDHAGGGNRIIYMNGQPHPPASVKLYLGDSRGHWEGNTLVVETTNFSQGFQGSNIETYKVVEHFTRVDAHNLRREITFDDPKTWTKPWTVLIEMGKSDDQRHMIFDSACHEGNYGMTGILVGNRQGQTEKK
jgi:hypothetical protein